MNEAEDGRSTEHWEEAVQAEGRICEFSIIKDLRDDLRIWQVFILLNSDSSVVPSRLMCLCAPMHLPGKEDGLYCIQSPVLVEGVQAVGKESESLLLPYPPA